MGRDAGHSYGNVGGLSTLVRTIYAQGTNCERPFAVQLPEGGYVLIHEAGLTDYARMLIVKDQEAENTLKVHMSGHLCGLFRQDDYVGYGFTLNEDEDDSIFSNVEGTTPFATPWRTFILADHAAELLCRSDMVLNLSEACNAEIFHI
ncbi:hypothetical protein J2T15_003216 [Paenibacillus harenae]|uniref:Glycosyl-hydrolase 97 N-terminal domain-containing protein n=2 Tax=Paenibacillus harenae TaxID=306543 RepID=A0ABT9U2D3_PAEHA|nr:hypothetical protein [Paenibacillus harenae]